MIKDYINDSEAFGIKGLCRQHELEAMFEEWEINDAIKNGTIYSPRPGFYKVVEAWEPDDKDVQWLVNLLDMLKVGGIWVWPSYGVIVHKTDENTLSLQPSLIPTPEATEMIRRTKKVAEKAGIYIDEPETVNPAFKKPGFFMVSSPAGEDDYFVKKWNEAQENTPPSLKVTTYESEKYIVEINEAVTKGQLKQAELYLDICAEANESKIVDTKGNVLATLRRK